jgi:GrpB-like predicted nucleotidyltransferase (UPF0157 family)
MSTEPSAKKYAPVVLQPYTREWAVMFERERELIRGALGERALAIEHIGSTAVPGLAAKPIIDVLIGIGDFAADAAACISPLEAIGLEYVPKKHADRYFFRRGPFGAGTHHVHLVQHGGDEWTIPLLFRDYLRAHPDRREAYQQLKSALAAELGAHRPDYSAAKNGFIQETLELARRG